MARRGRGEAALQERETRPDIPRFEPQVEGGTPDPELELAWMWMAEEDEMLGIVPYHDDYEEHQATHADQRQRDGPRPEDSY